MGNLTIATIFIVTLNVLMWFVTLSMQSMNPMGTMCYNLGGSIIENTATVSGNYSTLVVDPTGELPESQGSITAGSTNVFTDIFNNILSWFKTAPGIKYIYGVVAAPYNILKCANFPSHLVTGLGTIWYLVSFLVLVAFMWGRD